MKKTISLEEVKQLDIIAVQVFNSGYDTNGNAKITYLFYDKDFDSAFYGRKDVVRGVGILSVRQIGELVHISPKNLKELTDSLPEFTN